MKKRLPVLITTCNRHEHLKKCIQALERCTFAEETTVFVAVDFPPNIKYAEGYTKTCDYLKYLINNNGFLELKIIYRSFNLGASDNFQKLLFQVGKEYSAYIFMEDDIVVAPSFLDYCNKCLDKDSRNIFAICGYVADSLLLSDHRREFLMHGCNAWGTVFFKEKIEEINEWRSFDNLMIFFKSPKKALKLWYFNVNAFNIAVMGMLKGHNTSLFEEDLKPTLTDVLMCIYMVEKGFYALYPSNNLVKNIGLDGSGLNSQVGDTGSEITNFDSHYKCENEEVLSVVRSVRRRGFKAFLQEMRVLYYYFIWLFLK